LSPLWNNLLPKLPIPRLSLRRQANLLLRHPQRLRLKRPFRLLPRQ
jgi:hypothetical protein